MWVWKRQVLYQPISACSSQYWVSPGLPLRLSGKEPACNAEDLQEMQVQSVGWEDPLEKVMVSCSSILDPKNSVERGVWCAAIHAVAKSQTWFNNSNRCYTAMHWASLYAICIQPTALTGGVLRGWFVDSSRTKEALKLVLGGWSQNCFSCFC